MFCNTISYLTTAVRTKPRIRAVRRTRTNRWPRTTIYPV